MPQVKSELMVRHLLKPKLRLTPPSHQVSSKMHRLKQSNTILSQIKFLKGLPWPTRNLQL